MSTKQIEIQKTAINDISKKYFNSDTIYIGEYGTGTGKSKIFLESAKQILESTGNNVIISTCNNTLVLNYLEENKKHNVFKDDEIEVLIGVENYLDPQRVTSNIFLENSQLNKEDVEKWIELHSSHPLVNEFLKKFDLSNDYSDLINIEKDELDENSILRFNKRLDYLINNKKVYITNHIFLLTMYRILHSRYSKLNKKIDEDYEEIEEDIEIKLGEIEKLRRIPLLLDEVHTLNDVAKTLFSVRFSLYNTKVNISCLKKDEMLPDVLQRKLSAFSIKIEKVIKNFSNYQEEHRLERIKEFAELKEQIKKDKITNSIKNVFKKDLIEKENRRYLKNLEREFNELLQISFEFKIEDIEIELSPTKMFPSIKISNKNPIAKLRNVFFSFNKGFVCGLTGTFLIDKDRSIEANKWSFERIGIYKFNEDYELNWECKKWNSRINTSIIFKTIPRIFGKHQVKYYIFDDKNLIPPIFDKKTKKLEEKSKELELDYLDNISIAVKKSLNGNVLLLMSSFYNCEYIANKLNKDDEVKKIYEIIYSNRNESMQSTIKRYKKSIDNNKKAILIGNLSYYTGIDLPNEYINTLIFGKLPFEPLATIKSKQKIGTSSIIINTFKKAVLTFRQGLGRGIRNEKDRVFISILDPRILKREKRYKVFLDFLEEMGERIY